MTKLQDVDWNEVLRSYVDTKAELEVRVIGWDGKSDTFGLSIPPEDKARYDALREDQKLFFVARAEHFAIRVVGAQPPDKGKVADLCGELLRYHNGTLDTSYSFDALMKWNPDFLCWMIVCENGNWFQGLCGNVIGFTADVLTIVREQLPLLYEWDRPDAPKDGITRKWLLR